jgi:hypothetical protein
MTEIERLRADRDAAVYAALNTFDAVVYADRDAAYAAWEAAVNSASTARAAYDAVSKAYNAILAAQAKEQTND